MKPSKISYFESKESFDITTGLKSWRKAGVEIELEKDDEVGLAFDGAKKIVKDALVFIVYNTANGVMHETPPYVSPTILPTIDYSAKEKVEKAIDNAESLVELEKYITDALNYKIVAQYNAKRKTFIEGKSNQTP